MRERMNQGFLWERMLGMVMLWLLAIFAAWQMIGKGPLRWAVTQKETWALWAEMGILFLALFFMLCFLKGAGRILGISILVLLFSYLHVVCIPLIASFWYLLYAYWMGKWVRVKMRFSVRAPFLTDSLIGYSVLISVFSILSWIGMGEIAILRMVVIGTGIPISIWGMMWERQFGCLKKQEKTNQGDLSFFCLAWIGMLLLMELGRMNISLDFDSLWYGVRSEYILDNGGGIYENLGTMGVVYTYSKGLEILTLPFADLPSHSFLACFGIWFMALLLYASYLTACELADRKKALTVPVFLVSLPSVLNLSISVKTDTITLLIQIVMMYHLICYWKRRGGQDLVLALGALLFSWMLKPTAILFSTAVFGMSIFVFLWNRMFPKEWEEKRHIRWRAAFFPAAALGFVCARTVKITGVPFTSIFTGIFTKLGFTLRYPFSVESVPYSAAALTGKEKAIRVLKRTAQLLFCPIEEADMAHVVCAWGGLTVVLVFVVVCICAVEKKRCEVGKHRTENIPKEASYFRWILLPLTAANLLSFWQLKQIDGNYYNFYYALLLLAAVHVWGKSQIHIRCLKGMAIPVLGLHLLLCTLSSCSWQIGMTPIAWKNRGYYPHEELEKARMIEMGNEKIWEILAKEETNRVIVIGEHPAMLAFPCNAQSYYDVAGSWGNKNLVKDKESFIRFLEFAKTEYIYMQANWMTPVSENYQLMLQLVDAGILTDLTIENGNILAEVRIQDCETSETIRRENKERIQKEYLFYQVGE